MGARLVKCFVQGWALCVAWVGWGGRMDVLCIHLQEISVVQVACKDLVSELIYS